MPIELQTVRNGDCEELANISTAWGRRAKYYRLTFGSIPAGHVVDTTCDNPHCCVEAHWHLRKKIEPEYIYRPYVLRIEQLQINEYFDIPNAWSDRRSLNRFRCGLGSLAKRFIMRSMPDGTLRIIRRTDWSKAYAGDTEGEEPFLLLRTRRPLWRRPAVLWLGMNFGTLGHEPFKKPLICKIPACPMPVLKGAGEYCHHHNHFFDYRESMTDNALDFSTFWNPRKPHAGFELVAGNRPAATWALEKSLSFMAPGGYADNRHRSTTERPVKPTPVLNAGRYHMRRGGGSHSSSKTTAGKARAASRDHGSRHTTKEKRWTREVFAEYERQADEILKAEMGPAAEALREKQECELATRIYPLCQSYETTEPDLSEDEEREARIAVLFDQYDVADFGEATL